MAQSTPARQINTAVSQTTTTMHQHSTNESNDYGDKNRSPRQQLFRSCLNPTEGGDIRKPEPNLQVPPNTLIMTKSGCESFVGDSAGKHAHNANFDVSSDVQVLTTTPHCLCLDINLKVPYSMVFRGDLFVPCIFLINRFSHFSTMTEMTSHIMFECLDVF